MYDHLTRGNFFHIGFNNIKYGYLLIHNFLTNYSRYKYESSFATVNSLYLQSQELINSDAPTEFIKDKDMKILQIDLMSVFHLNYKSKRTSLKDLQFAFGCDIKYPKYDTDYWLQKDDLQHLIDCVKTDVNAIYQLYKLSLGNTDHPLYKNINELKLRKDIKKEFRINCLNYPNVKIGEQLILSLYCKSTGKKWSEVKELQTNRSHVDLKDCIPYYTTFESKEFNNVLSLIRNKTVDTSLMNFETEVVFHGIKLSLGCGGIHGSAKSGIYKSDDKNIIISLDVESLYPCIARTLGLYPEHLGKVFNDIYSPFIDLRLAEKRKPHKNLTLIKAFKYILNSVCGKTNEPKSFLLDQLYFLRMTFAGQMFTCMWLEKIAKACPEVQFLLVNTDGIEILCPRDKENIILNSFSDFIKEVNFSVEKNYYNQLIIKNVNEYIAEYNDHTPEKEHLKLKGCFEINKEIQKDPSMRIVSIALKNYFIYNIPVMKTIKNHTNIFDFCIRLKLNKSSRAKYFYLENNQSKHIELGQTTRYYCSNSGGSISVYYNNSESPNRLNKDYSFTLFNEYHKKDYDINYQFYLAECNKIKNVIEDMQLSLF